MASLYHTHVMLVLDGYSISTSCRLGPGWPFYIILVSSTPLMVIYIILVFSWYFMAILYHTRVVHLVDGYSILYSCPHGP